jgi:hypothetical protein
VQRLTQGIKTKRKRTGGVGSRFKLKRKKDKERRKKLTRRLSFDGVTELGGFRTTEHHVTDTSCDSGFAGKDLGKA